MFGVKMLKELKEKTRGLKDPGTALIVVYMSIIIFLLLFAGLESVRADLVGTKEKTLTMDDDHRGELLIPIQEVGRHTAAPLLSPNVKTSVIGMAAKTATPTELFRVLGYILLLLALLLAKDGKKR